MTQENPFAPKPSNVVVETTATQVQQQPVQQQPVQQQPVQQQPVQQQPVQQQPVPQPMPMPMPQPQPVSVPAVRNTSVPSIPVPFRIDACPEVAGISEIDLDTDIQLNELEKFPDLKKDEVTRIAFLLFNEKGSPRLKVSQTFFSEEHKCAFVAPTHNKDLFHGVWRSGEIPKCDLERSSFSTALMPGEPPPEWAVQ